MLVYWHITYEGIAVLTLTDAIKTDRLGKFIAQEEARGVGKAELRKIETLIKAAAKPPQSVGRTSRSASACGSREKRIP